MLLVTECIFVRGSISMGRYFSTRSLQKVKTKPATDNKIIGCSFIVTNIISLDNLGVNCILYRVSQEECARLREGVRYVKVYRYNPKHLCPKLNGFGDNGQRNLKL
jgi:hypothetical protein